MKSVFSAALFILICCGAGICCGTGMAEELELHPRLKQLPSKLLGPFTHTRDGRILAIDSKATFVSENGGTTWQQIQKMHDDWSGCVRDMIQTKEGRVTVQADFPGGNVAVLRNDGSTVQLAPDLRGDAPWFYWYFEAQASQPGRVRFAFPEKVAGFKNGAIGFQGPAISTDRGQTWKWMGTDNVDGSSFFFDFAKTDERVRFAVTIPYVQAELNAFLKKNARNPHLKTSVLTTSRHGRDVQLLQVGRPGLGVKAVLVTARHHATETIASYVLEGFLQAAMSDSPAGEEFRKKYVLFAVPLVDKDGD